MRDIATKADGTTNLSAGDWNANQSELENIVTSTDQTLDPAGGVDTDLNMLAKAAAGYAGAGWAYQDSGAADAYVLAIASNLKPITKYFDNLMVAFKPGNNNTGASTVNVGGLGVKAIKIAGADPGAGEISSSRILILKYSLSSGYFEVVSGAVEKVSIRGISRNLVIKNGSTPDEQVDIDADEILLQNIGGFTFRVANVNFTADNTASGQNGLFTGSVAASTEYFLWITSGLLGTTSGIHLSSDLATVLGDAPASYNDFGALVGANFTDGTSDWISIYQVGNKVIRANSAVLSGGATTSYAPVDVSSAIPSTAKAVFGTLRNGPFTGAGFGGVFVAGDVNGLGEIQFGDHSSTTANAYSPFRIPVMTPQTIWYKVIGVTAMDIVISGWEY